MSGDYKTAFLKMLTHYNIVDYQLVKRQLSPFRTAEAVLAPDGRSCYRPQDGADCGAERLPLEGGEKGDLKRQGACCNI